MSKFYLELYANYANYIKFACRRFSLKPSASREKPAEGFRVVDRDPKLGKRRGFHGRA